MCGIIGFVKFSHFKNDKKFMSKMLSRISHRGPDYQGYKSFLNERVFIGHTRLSILDLSNRGNQPMQSSSGRYCIAFNGEIYNHNQIRKNIIKNKKITWRSTSDTETILESLEVFGIKKTLESLEGMFAISLFDSKENKIILARDLYGEKPLYYGLHNKNFFFSSDLSTLEEIDSFERKIDLKSLNLFLNLSYIPEPYTIYENFFKLKPSSFLEIDLNIKNFNINNLKVTEFNKKNNKNDIIIENSFESKVSELDDLMHQSVSETMLSDVEVGSFLSGGVDSSIISYYASNISNKKIKTFSATFENSSFDESFYSNQISQLIKSEHYNIKIDTKNTREVLYKIPDIYSEPFADSSQIACSILAKKVSNYLKVVLTGDGADEHFCGYNRYILINKYYKFIKRYPNFIKKLISNLILCVPYKFLTQLESILINLFKLKKMVQINDKLKKLVYILSSKSDCEIFFNTISAFNPNLKNILNIEVDSVYLNVMKNEFNKFNDHMKFEKKMMNFDQKYYISGDIAPKIDRSSMFYSLEARMPFLNSKIINFAENLDTTDLIDKNIGGKKILKHLLKTKIPNFNIKRPKMGFSLPLNEWLRTDLKKDMQQILNLNHGKSLGSLINKKVIDQLVNDHLNGKQNYSQLLWNVMVMNLWFDKKNAKI